MKPYIDKLTEIAGAKILEYLTLTDKEKRTGNTTHHIVGKKHTDYHGLAICQYENEDGVYLFYCNSDWIELTDTHHEDIDSAKDQASYEFEGLENKWIKK